MARDLTNHPLFQELIPLLKGYDWDWQDGSTTSPPRETDRIKELLLQLAGRNNRHYHAAILSLWRQCTNRPFRVGKLRLASDVEPGEWFAKTEDAFQYTRIADNAARFYNMSKNNQGSQTFVFGVSSNGNITEVLRDRIVWTKGTHTVTAWTNRGWQEQQSAGYDPFCGLPQETEDFDDDRE